MSDPKHIPITANLDGKTVEIGSAMLYSDGVVAGRIFPMFMDVFSGIGVIGSIAVNPKEED